MSRIRVLLLTASISVCLVPGVANQLQEADSGQEENRADSPRNLIVDDLFEIRRVQDAQLSPESRWVAYTITTISLEKEKSETRVWMAPLVGGKAIPMTAKGSSATRPRWSPDGKY